MVMYLEGASETLDGSAQITFQTVTADHINNSFLEDLKDLDVGSDIKRQEILAPSSSRARMLAQDAGSLKILFDTRVSFRSPTTTMDVAALIGASFDTDEDRSAYLKRLQWVGGESFANVTSISVEINGVPQQATVQTQQQSNGVDLPVIIGATLGGVALVGILLVVFLRSRKSQRNDDNYTFTSSKKDIGHEHVNMNIVMEPQDDISTLGDPMPGILVLQQDDVSTLGEPITDSALDKDETVSGSMSSGDYDYVKNYGQKSPSKAEEALSHLKSINSTSSESALGKMDNDVLPAEDSFDKQFDSQFDTEEMHYEVNAPAGKLGMVIDTPSGGAPVIHAIKSTSTMIDKGVQVGDQLVAIDGIDTTGLTAMQVSKLISQKAANPSRILEFVRTKTPGIAQ
jgi:hypothetical protein